MAEMGTAMMGNGEATGPNRALEAAHMAITNPLLDIISMKGAKGVLINITGGLDMTLYEVDAAANEIRAEVDPQANIILGSTFDESMEGIMRVSVVATGIDDEAVVSQNTTVPHARRAADGYAGPVAPRRNLGAPLVEPSPAGADLEPSYEDEAYEPRPTFSPDDRDDREKGRKGGFGLFGRKKPAEREQARAAEDRPVAAPESGDLDEELEIPAFLRRQMTQR
jgi:cell division protein FtsZ